MKKKIVFIFLLLPLSLLAQQAFHIKGNAPGLKSGTKIYLSYLSGRGNLLDSSTVKAGSFAFNGTVGEPVRGVISFEPTTRGVKKDQLVLYIEPAKIAIAVADSLKSAKITGSQLNADDEALRLATKSEQDEIAEINAEYKKATQEQKKEAEFMKGFAKRYMQATEKLLVAQLDFAKSHPNSYISAGLLAPMAAKEKFLDEAEKAFLALSPQVRQTKSGQLAAEALTAAQKTKIGQPAIPFTQNDVNGKPVSLADFKGKYVLVDFWASWCVPCRKENPHVVAAFRQFKDKGFTVLGVSLDKADAYDAWVKAIADDKLEWTQVSDLKFWDNEVARAYGVKSVPANFLISPDGKIIAKGLRGERLSAKLAELLGAENKTK